MRDQAGDGRHSLQIPLAAHAKDQVLNRADPEGRRRTGEDLEYHPTRESDPKRLSGPPALPQPVAAAGVGPSGDFFAEMFAN